MEEIGFRARQIMSSAELRSQQKTIPLYMQVSTQWHAQIDSTTRKCPIIMPCFTLHQNPVYSPIQSATTADVERAPEGQISSRTDKTEKQKDQGQMQAPV